MDGQLIGEGLAVLTFVCDQCGTTGSVSAPGSARCTACGYVALVQAPAGWRATPEPDPFAASTGEPARADHDVRGGTAPPAERRATLWVRPGSHETPTPDPSTIAPARRARPVFRTAIAAAVLAGGAAVAFAAAVMVVDRRSFDRGAESTDAAPPAPVQPPAPPSVLPAAPRERGVSTGAGKTVHATPAKQALATAARQASTPLSALVNPAPADRRCVPQALRARRDLADRLPGEISVRFRVTASGDVARIEVPGVADRDLADAIAGAVRSCRFLPGTDEEGRPVALPIVMRIRFASALREHSRLDGGRVE